VITRYLQGKTLICCERTRSASDASSVLSGIQDHIDVQRNLWATNAPAVRTFEQSKFRQQNHILVDAFHVAIHKTSQLPNRQRAFTLSHSDDVPPARSQLTEELSRRFKVQDFTLIRVGLRQLGGREQCALPVGLQCDREKSVGHLTRLREMASRNIFIYKLAPEALTPPNQCKNPAPTRIVDAGFDSLKR